MTGLVNQKLNENSKHNGCVFKFKGKSARDIIKLATTQKWVETQQELQEMAKRREFQQVMQREKMLLKDIKNG